MRVATNWHPPFLSASFNTVGLVNGASYLIGADGTLTQVGNPSTTDISASFKTGNVPNRNLFQLPADASGVTVCWQGGGQAFTAAAGLVLELFPMFYPQPVGNPSGAYQPLPQAVGGGSQALGFLTDGFNTVAGGGGGWIAGQAVVPYVSWPYFSVMLFATTYPSASGTPFVQGRFV